MKKYIIYIPVIIALIIQAIDRDGSYRTLQILLLIATVLIAIIFWKYRKK